MAKRIVIPDHPLLQQVASLQDLGLPVRGSRTKSNLRIDTAAALCGVSVSLLSALENGNGRAVRVDKLLEVLDGLGLAMLITTKDEAEKLITEVNGE